MRCSFRLAALLLALAATFPLFGSGVFWDFLGCTRVDGAQDHGSIQIARRDRLFHTIQLRVSGEAIFFDRLILHFDNGSSQEHVISGRIFPEGRSYIIELPDDRRFLESVELWYYKQPWGHTPMVTIYGVRLPESDHAVLGR